MGESLLKAPPHSVEKNCPESAGNVPGDPVPMKLQPFTKVLSNSINFEVSSLVEHCSTL